MAQPKNSDAPAYPVTDEKGKVAGGLSKREKMALGCVRTAAALHPDESPKFIAQLAVVLADRLLHELENG